MLIPLLKSSACDTPWNPNKCTDLLPLNPNKCTDLLPWNPNKCTDLLPWNPSKCTDLLPLNPSKCTDLLPWNPSKCTNLLPLNPNKCTDLLPLNPSKCTDLLPLNPTVPDSTLLHCMEKENKTQTLRSNMKLPLDSSPSGRTRVLNPGRSLRSARVTLQLKVQSPGAQSPEPRAGLRSQVSGLGSRVSGLGSQRAAPGTESREPGGAPAAHLTDTRRQSTRLHSEDRQGQSSRLEVRARAWRSEPEPGGQSPSLEVTAPLALLHSSG
ncbi:hypothetical protein EYF80_059702 [Liparis tanakae]|uniref:Uncharacterized protein n=1 Tax=Liparis tanakae TaxID=230148 RepID=A0A4Z2EMH8_9TELE|nr:hypothetical protein EYF80_059702 [Liparis tanakae]